MLRLVVSHGYKQYLALPLAVSLTAILLAPSRSLLVKLSGIFYENTPVTINMAAIIKTTKTITIKIITEFGLVYLSFSIRYSFGINEIPTLFGWVLLQQIQA